MKRSASESYGAPQLKRTNSTSTDNGDDVEDQAYFHLRSQNRALSLEVRKSKMTIESARKELDMMRSKSREMEALVGTIQRAWSQLDIDTSLLLDSLGDTDVRFSLSVILPPCPDIREVCLCALPIVKHAIFCPVLCEFSPSPFLHLTCRSPHLTFNSLSLLLCHHFHLNPKLCFLMGMLYFALHRLTSHCRCRRWTLRVDRSTTCSRISCMWDSPTALALERPPGIPRTYPPCPAWRLTFGPTTTPYRRSAFEYKLFWL